MNKKITNIKGLSGLEEYLAVKMLNNELEALNQFFPDLKDAASDKYPEDVDDADCNEDEDNLSKFDETQWLEDGASSTYGDLDW